MARQTGKTEYGAARVLQRAALVPDGESCVLVPTYRLGLVPAERLRRLAPPGSQWLGDTKQALRLPNKHVIWIRSADRPDATRGLTITGTLWVDEAALISEAAWNAALGTLVTARNPLALVTTTPKGRGNWVYRLWHDGGPDVARFICRSLDSPFANAKLIAHLRAGMGTNMASQELDAVFTDDRSTPFPPEVVERLFSRRLERRGKRWTLGVDLAKEVDYTVCVAMNEFGEAWLAGRWRHVAWPDTEARIVQLLREWGDGALVLDVGGTTGYGGAMSDYLARALGKRKHALFEVRTGQGNIKAEVIETLIADAEHGRIFVDPEGEMAQAARHELQLFTADRKVSGGVERVVYSAPEGEDEHDDCVIALALANYGRIHAWEGKRDLGGEAMRGFVDDALGRGKTPPSGGVGDWGGVPPEDEVL
jgi:hypothetical protein